ncbi:MAG: ATP-dependent DNA helicase RecG [Pirellulales bacterium]|nr:ATP-dependent DNA helicase RecG [Pirellulales bacterium]
MSAPYFQSDAPGEAAPPPPTPAERLATPVEYLRGCGRERAQVLAKLGIHSVGRLLFHFPRDYQDYRDLIPIAELKADTTASVRGTVSEVSERLTKSGTRMLGVLITDGTHALRALWFNQPYLKPKFRNGQSVLLSGKVKLSGMRWEMAHPRIQWLEEDENVSQGRMLPVYPLSEGITQGQMRYLLRVAVEAYAHDMDEVFPAELLQRWDLLPIATALRQIHWPENPAELEQAQRRFVFQELLVLQLALALRRQAQHIQLHSPALPLSAKIDARIRRLFPFELTAAQDQAIREIAADLGRTVPMNRLLQGDVGSGKTIVAVYAMLLAVAHGYQAVLMAPTEVLARQHARTLARLLSGSQVRAGLLTGTLTPQERSATVASIQAGETSIIIGTQAVLSEDVRFQRLGLVVIDEQHKFGVRQRSGLRQAGQNPHYLVMTATPIPRTITMSLYGDLDTSTIREAPPGRQAMYTYVGTADKRPRWWDFVRKKFSEGRQGYFVTPLVEESENWDAASLNRVHGELAQGELRDYRLGILHGRMSSHDKDQTMRAFAAGQLDGLVCTSVVEVGVDIPNATLMTIYDAERFGLSQLHQLRGRVHRGKYPGYCCLLPGTDELTEEAAKRLQAMVDTYDGFALAEVDFDLRGPGELFGTKQHGLPPFYVADLQRDRILVMEARAAAQQLASVDQGLQLPEHAKLRKKVLEKYGRDLDLGDVG